MEWFFFVKKLAFWDELDESQREKLHAELKELELEDVTTSFKRCLQQFEEEGKKLDDQASSKMS